MKFNVDGLLRGDYQSRMNGYAIGIQNGFMSPNDVRTLECLDLIPDELGGNKYMCNGNMIDIASVGNQYQTDNGDNNNEKVLEVEKSDGNTGNGADAPGKNSVPQRHNFRNELARR